MTNIEFDINGQPTTIVENRFQNINHSLLSSFIHWYVEQQGGMRSIFGITDDDIVFTFYMLAARPKDWC